MNLSWKKSKLEFPKGSSDTPTSNIESTLLDEEPDLADIEAQCKELKGSASSQAFGGASWNYDFSKQTRHSWNFAGFSNSSSTNDPLIPEIIFDENNSSRIKKNVTFQVRSIVGICRIKESADLVTGFLGCDQLIIERRSKPLRIIASIIAGNALIHPDALRSGIVWSTIYHPQATFELRSAGVLKASAGANCDSMTEPIWHPIPSIQNVQNRYSCNSISLRDKADPFRWSMVDPDCGLLPGATNTSCKRRPMKFYIVEHGRERPI